MEQKKRSSKLLKTVLTVSLLFLSACSCLPKDPDIRPKQILKRQGVCYQYTMKFQEKVVFKFDKEIPVSECLIDGSFVLTEEELIKARNFYNEAKKCYEQKCKAP